MAALAFEQAAAHFRDCARVGRQESGQSKRRSSSSSEPPPTLPAAGRTRSRRSLPPRRSDARPATRTCSRAPRSGWRTPAGARANLTGRRWSCSRRRARPSARRTIDAPGQPALGPWSACSHTAETTSGPRSSCRTRSRWRAGSATGEGSRPSSRGRTRLAARARSRRVLEMLTEALGRGGRAGRPRDPSGGDGLAGGRRGSPWVSSRRRDATSTTFLDARKPREAALLLLRGASKSPRRSRCAKATSRRPRPEPNVRPQFASLLSRRDASGIHGIQMFSIRREQGRLAELAPAAPDPCATATAAPPPGALAWRHSSSSSAWPTRPAASSRGSALTGSSRSARRSGSPRSPISRTLAPRLATRSLPRSSSPSWSRTPEPIVVVGHGVACYGAADRYLGMLAATLGDWEVAETRFDAAMDVNRRMGAATWLAHTAYEYGRMLHAARSPGRRGRAASMLSEAVALAERIGMPTLLARIDAATLSRSRPDHLAARWPLPARGRHPPAWPRAGSPTARSAKSCSSAAHRRQPHPQHPAQDVLREPHGGRHLRASSRTGRGPGRGVGSRRCRSM